MPRRRTDSSVLVPSQDLQWSKQSGAAPSDGKEAGNKTVQDPAKARAWLAFEQLFAKFGPRLLEAVPKMWQAMAGVCYWYVSCVSAVVGTLTLFADSVGKMDEQMEKRDGQDVIDSMSVLKAVVATFHADLSRNFTELSPHVILALRSRFAIVRQSAARCFATICDILTVDAMRYVIETVVPYLGDADAPANCQGGIELVYHEDLTFILIIFGVGY